MNKAKFETDTKSFHVKIDLHVQKSNLHKAKIKQCTHNDKQITQQFVAKSQTEIL